MGVYNMSDRANSALESVVTLEPEALRCPYPYYAHLRREAPVLWSEVLQGFVVSRYHDVLEVLRATDVFSSAAAHGSSGATPRAQSIVDRADAPEDLRSYAARRVEVASCPVLLYADPPLHTRQRRLVNRAFSPSRVTALEPGIEEVANRLVDAFVACGEVELISQFCVGLPLEVIARALGVPRSELDTFKLWSDAFVGSVGRADLPDDDATAIYRAMSDFYEYFAEQIEDRRQSPRDDLLTAVVESRVDGDQPLELNEMLNMLSQFLVAGNETTTKALADVVCRLATNPELNRAVRRNRSLVEPLVEESLRLEPPVQGLFRTALADTEVGGVLVPAGSSLWLLYASANRDDAEFPVADEVELARPNPRGHLTFGTGAHYCLGAPLARIEMRVGIDVLLSRLDDIRLAVPLESLPREPSFVMRGLQELPLTFRPAPA